MQKFDYLERNRLHATHLEMDNSFLSNNSAEQLLFNALESKDVEKAEQILQQLKSGGINIFGMRQFPQNIEEPLILDIQRMDVFLDEEASKRGT